MIPQGFDSPLPKVVNGHSLSETEDSHGWEALEYDTNSYSNQTGFSGAVLVASLYSESKYSLEVHTNIL